MIAIAICSLVMAATALGLSLAQPTGNWAGVFAGCLFTALGVAGMFYSRHYLGRFWTAETTVRADHKVIDRGPYSLVRHPIYACAILMYVGLGLAFTTWWNALAAGIILCAYALKARDEDRFLEKNLDGYAAYRQRVTAALIPGVW
jgi:protein-S-isoprenylcysteine O-methyltransferase Ste14